MLKRLLSSSNIYNWAIAVGHGFFAGIFLVTLLLRGFDFLRMPISFISITIALVLCGAALMFYLNRGPAVTPTVASSARAFLDISEIIEFFKKYFSIMSLKS